MMRPATSATLRQLGFLGLGLLLGTQPASAWGPIGHRMVAETAAILLERASESNTEKNSPLVAWAQFLSRHRFELGYYSMVPDSLYRHIDGHAGRIESPTHFLDLDLLISEQTPEKLKEIPLDYKAAKAFFEKKLGPQKAKNVGSVPWRVEQFLGRATEEFKKIKTFSGTYERGETARGDVRSIYQALYDLGVMSHYSGDVTMPYHASSDWNGVATGEGGIHFYFESDCVNALEPGLSKEVLELAQRERSAWEKAWKKMSRPSEVILSILLESGKLVSTVSQLDLENAVLKKSSATEKTALRKPARQACGVFRELLVERLAKASALTAFLWEQVLPSTVKLGQHDLLQFSDMKWASTYIVPDYTFTAASWVGHE